MVWLAHVGYTLSFLQTHDTNMISHFLPTPSALPSSTAGTILEQAVSQGGGEGLSLPGFCSAVFPQELENQGIPFITCGQLSCFS